MYTQEMHKKVGLFFLFVQVVLVILFIFQSLAHSCDIEPGDWAEVEEELEND